MDVFGCLTLFYFNNVTAWERYNSTLEGNKTKTQWACPPATALKGSNRQICVRPMCNAVFSACCIYIQYRDVHISSPPQKQEAYSPSF